MKRRKKQPNIAAIAALVVFAVAVFACVPLVGDWILESFIYPDKAQCRQEITLEAGEPLPPAGDFFPGQQVDAVYLTDMSKVSSNVPGTYPVELKAGNKTYTAKLVIGDTVAPTGKGVNVTVGAQGALKAEDFVTDIQDATAVTVTFVTSPDWSISGTQNVSILLTDAGGNTATVQATLTYVPDTQAPVILGAKDLDAYVKGTVSYKSGITVTDNADSNPTLEIDRSKVDLSKAGVYPVTYKATDSAGNVATVTVKLTVREKGDNFVDPEIIYAKVDAILAQFIREDMTDREKAEAVYVWTRREIHLTYDGTVKHNDDWLQLAYEFLQTRKGDCYHFHAIQKLMLQRLNIPTIDVWKVKNPDKPKDSNHVWLLVSVDGGKNYYHYDNTWAKDLCLVTDAQLDQFSAQQDSNPFNRDKSLYPATPTQSLPESTLPWDDPAILNATP